MPCKAYLAISSNIINHDYVSQGGIYALYLLIGHRINIFNFEVSLLVLDKVDCTVKKMAKCGLK